MVRSLPYVEALSLCRAEESQEEADMRQSLGLVPLEVESAMPDAESAIPDVVMAEPPPVPTPPKTNKSILVPTTPEVPAIVHPSQPLPKIPEPTSRPINGPTVEAAKAPVPSPFPIKAVNDVPVQSNLPIFVEEEEKNEEMPAIDLGSDSDLE